jgi:hypothetical protein
LAALADELACTRVHAYHRRLNPAVVAEIREAELSYSLLAITGKFTLPSYSSVCYISMVGSRYLEAILPEELILFPSVKAILTVPFWLPFGPSPLPVEARRRMLRAAAVDLTRDIPSIQWEVPELEWSREPQSIPQPKIWHPKAATNRKGCILRGTFIEDESLKSAACAI